MWKESQGGNGSRYTTVACSNKLVPCIHVSRRWPSHRTQTITPSVSRVRTPCAMRVTVPCCSTPYRVAATRCPMLKFILPMFSVEFKVVATAVPSLDTIPTAEAHVLQLFAVGREDRAATLAALRRFRFVFHHTVIYLCGSEKGSGLLRSLQLGHHHDSGVVLLRSRDACVLSRRPAFYASGKERWLTATATNTATHSMKMITCMIKKSKGC